MAKAEAEKAERAEWALAALPAAALAVLIAIWLWIQSVASAPAYLSGWVPPPKEGALERAATAGQTLARARVPCALPAMSTDFGKAVELARALAHFEVPPAANDTAGKRALTRLKSAATELGQVLPVMPETAAAMRRLVEDKSGDSEKPLESNPLLGDLVGRFPQLLALRGALAATATALEATSVALTEEDRNALEVPPALRAMLEPSGAAARVQSLKDLGRFLTPEPVPGQALGEELALAKGFERLRVEHAAEYRSDAMIYVLLIWIAAGASILLAWGPWRGGWNQSQRVALLGLVAAGGLGCLTSFLFEDSWPYKILYGDQADFPRKRDLIQWTLRVGWTASWALAFGMGACVLRRRFVPTIDLQRWIRQMLYANALLVAGVTALVVVGFRLVYLGRPEAPPDLALALGKATAGFHVLALLAKFIPAYYGVVVDPAAAAKQARDAAAESWEGPLLKFAINTLAVAAPLLAEILVGLTTKG